MRIHKESSDKEYEERVRREHENRLNRINGDDNLSMHNQFIEESDY